MPKPTLAELEAFAAVASHRSFRKAADAMGTSRSAVSHTLAGLERTLGVRLLNRTTRSVSLSEAGHRLLERIGPVLRDLDTALDELSEERPRGMLRINANRAGASILLAEVVPQYQSLFPEVELDLVSEGRLVDVVAEGFDAGVRLFEAVPQDMVAVPIGGEVRFVAVAADTYLDRHAAPDTPDDLRRHACIRHRLPSGKRYRWEFSRRGENVAVDVPGVLTLDDPDLMVAAASEGLGIAYVPEFFAREALRSGRLRAVLDAWCPSIPGLALYYPTGRHVRPALRAFVDLLRKSNHRD